MSFVKNEAADNVDLVSTKLKGVLTESGLAQQAEKVSDPDAADNFLVTRHRHRVLLE